MGSMGHYGLYVALLQSPIDGPGFADAWLEDLDLWEAVGGWPAIYPSDSIVQCNNSLLLSTAAMYNKTVLFLFCSCALTLCLHIIGSHISNCKIHI